MVFIARHFGGLCSQGRTLEPPVWRDQWGAWPFYSSGCCIVSLSLYLQLWKISSAHLQVIFRDSCSVSICNFGMPMGGIELRIFLLCHFDPDPVMIVLNLSNSLVGHYLSKGSHHYLIVIFLNFTKIFIRNSRACLQLQYISQKTPATTSWFIYSDSLTYLSISSWVGWHGQRRYFWPIFLNSLSRTKD